MEKHHTLEIENKILIEKSSKYIFNVIIEKFIDICIKNKITIFDSYVREYISKQQFNPLISNIEIFSKKITKDNV